MGKDDYKNGLSRRVSEIRLCQECGNQYVADRDYRKFCGLSCSARSRGQRQVAPTFTPTARSCEVCGTAFTSRRRAHTNCSERCARVVSTWRAYGLTPREVFGMYESQRGKCAACFGPLPRPPDRECHVDHCHSTGAVRGLLCRSCNYTAGWIEKRGDLVSAYPRQTRI